MNTGGKGKARDMYRLGQEKLEAFFKGVPPDTEYRFSMTLKLERVRCTKCTLDVRCTEHCRPCTKGIACPIHRGTA